MPDSRTEAKSLLKPLSHSSLRTLVKFAACLVVSMTVALLPEHDGLGDAGRWALFILLLSAGLWISEAIPAFAVGLLVIGLEIAILGRPGGVFATDADDWERFIDVWGSPLIWLFFGGFVLAAAAEKTGLTTWIATHVLRRLGDDARMQLFGCMAVTFVFSMFISNTATATLVIAMVMPRLKAMPSDDRFRSGLLLGIVAAANLGGMGTVIGSPPNAIAAESLRHVDAIDFAGWVVAGLFPATGLLALAWLYLVVRFPSNSNRLDTSHLDNPPSLDRQVPDWHRLAVIVVFATTVGLWLSNSLHGIPATVISFVPICCLTTLGVLNSGDIRTIPWDVLLLIAGGLALGIAVTDTGLANWLIARLPLDRFGLLGLVLLLSTSTLILSNLMSNTAAANILIPIAIVATTGNEQQSVVPIALSASAAMCLPISTPPNAIAYGTGMLSVREIFELGAFIGILTPIVVTLWCRFIL
ncbi:MAG: DASS family sodium-coupled anion symporter [Pirellulaceae bacterium]